MSRKVRAFEEALAPRRKEEEGKLLRQDGVWVLTWERTYTLITPLVGGGVEPGKKDPVSVVRATEVRGQLRFWWRALRGWQAKGSLEELRKLESALFGSAGEGGASPVVVEVEVLKERGKADHQNARGVQQGLGSPRRGKGGWAPVKEGVAFRLRLRFPERVKSLNLAEELEAALWAWETFGGIGARTRRGFGALLREGASPPTEEEIREGLGRYSRQGGWPEGVPHLTPQSLVRVVPLSWKKLSKRYQFKDGGDPPDTTLKLPEAVRRASPLLFRPLGEGQRPCVVAVLEGTRFPGKKPVLEHGRSRTWEVDPIRAFVESL
jgi:CRISPR-associated protein Cmr1